MEYWVTVQGQKLAAHAGQRLHSVLTQAGFLAFCSPEVSVYLKNLAVDNWDFIIYNTIIRGDYSEFLKRKCDAYGK